jgi:hypothetical protein
VSAAQYTDTHVCEHIEKLTVHAQPADAVDTALNDDTHNKCHQALTRRIRENHCSDTYSHNVHAGLVCVALDTYSSIVQYILHEKQK